MQLITCLAVIAFAGYATAQNCDAVASSVPACAATCINSAASVAGCKAGDYGCQCSSSQSAAINTLALNCVVSNCGIETGLAASKSANAVCACATTGLASATSAPATATSASASPSAKTSAAPLTTTSPPRATATPSRSGAVGSSVSGGSFVSGASGTVAQGPSTCVPVKAATSSPECSQQVAKIPSCALTCFSNGISEIGCAHTDYACQCSAANKAALTSNITPCVLKACSQSDALSVQSAADGVCKCANDWVMANPKATTCYAMAGASVSISGSGSFAPGSSIPPPSFYATTRATTTTRAASTTPAATTPSPAPVATAAAGRLSIGFGMAGAAVLAVFAL